MSKVSPLVDSLIESIQCLPGVGPKSAQRMVLHLLEREREGGKLLSEALSLALESVGQCRQCRIFSEDELCSICNNEKRDKQVICVWLSQSQMYLL